MRRPRSRSPATPLQSLFGARNTALLLAGLSLLVTIGPFFLLYYSPPDDVFLGPEVPNQKIIAEARARRDSYRKLPDKDNPVKVYIYPDKNGLQSEGRLLQFVNDGVEASARLQLTDIPEGDNTAWIVDLSKVKCKDLVAHVQETLGRRMNAFRNRFAPKGGPTAATRFTSEILWPLYLLDFSDYGYVLDDDNYYNINDLTTDCIRPLSDLLGKRNMYFASRQHVSGRRITYEEKEDEDPIGVLGKPIEFGKLFCANFMSGTVRQIHHGARTVMNDSLLKVAGDISSRGGGGGTGAFLRGDELAALPRPKDVAYFWKIGSDDVRTGEHRDRVRDALLEVRNSTALSIYAGAVAEGLGSIRSGNVTDPVAREMLQYKILVVAQKDRYEGHHRLMDALLSGSLVMTDPMHPLPVGLRDKDSLVVYKSMADLKKKILHYLSHEEERRNIGRKGREVALKYHSPAAWVERVVLGNWSSASGL